MGRFRSCGQIVDSCGVLKKSRLMGSIVPMDDPKKIARIKHDRFVHEISMRAKYRREEILADLARRGVANGGCWTAPTLKLGNELGKELAAGLVKIHIETVGPDDLDFEETAKWIYREVRRLWDSLARYYLERD